VLDAGGEKAMKQPKLNVIRRAIRWFVTRRRVRLLLWRCDIMPVSVTYCQGKYRTAKARLDKFQLEGNGGEVKYYHGQSLAWSLLVTDHVPLGKDRNPKFDPYAGVNCVK
jgi:hypothetical protein